MEIQWKQFLLGEVCRSVSSKGSLIKGKQIQKYSVGLYPAYSATGQDIWREEYEHEGEAIIVSAVGARCGKCFRADGKWTAVANTHIIFPRESVDRNFLFYQVNNENFWEKGGVAQPFVKIKDSLRRKTVTFPVDKNGNPNLVEQKRVVTILEEAENLKKKRAEADQKMNAILPALFVEMFGDDKAVSNGDFDDFEIQIVDGDRGKNYPNGDDFSREGYCLFLNTGNIVDDKFRFDKVSFISESKDSALGKGKINIGDIIFTTRGTVGNVAYFSNELPYRIARINSGMVILRNYQKHFIPEYLHFFLHSPFFKRQYLKKGSGSAQPQLPIRDMRKLRLVKPSMEDQMIFSQKVKDFSAQKEKQKRSAEKLDNVFQTLLAGLFTRGA